MNPPTNPSSYKKPVMKSDLREAKIIGSSLLVGLGSIGVSSSESSAISSVVTLLGLILMIYAWSGVSIIGLFKNLIGLPKIEEDNTNSLKKDE